MTQAIVELRSAVRPHLEKLSAGDRILVAVSGGADSLALAGALLIEAKDLLVTCIGVTIDHQLQDGSEIQARKVVNQLERIGFSEVVSQQVEVDRDLNRVPEMLDMQRYIQSLNNAAQFKFILDILVTIKPKVFS
jgi:tRNA(Ile)-lysidine synthase TilS/MesJ